MKTSLIASTCALLLQAAAVAQTPASLPGNPFPKFNSAAEVKAACDSGLKGAAQRVKALETRPVDIGWLAAFDDLNVYQEDVQYPIEFLPNVHPDKAVREAADACSARWADFTSSVGQNEKLYRAAKRAPAPDAIDREFQRIALGDFEDSGVSLPAAKRKRAKQILDKLNDLRQRFETQIRDENTQLAFDEKELAGVPEAVWKEAKRNAQGQVLLGLSYPVYFPVMEQGSNAAARERMWRAKTNEGGLGNIKLLDEIATLRREYAALFGFDNYTDFTLRRRMAKNAKTALSFLDEVKAAAVDGERADMAMLRAAKAQHLGTALDATKLERWDTAFYLERLRKQRFDVDQEAFRPYFPPQETLQFTLRIVEKLMGVRYTRVAADLWHPEAQAYAVSDVSTGKPIATMYVDLYPREGKYNHAAVWPLRASATRIGRTPMAALVVNFDRKGLTLGEVETLLHELGHAVHDNVGQTRYSGGGNVMRDFVEAPSQMLEDWVYDKKVLALMAEVCPTCKPVPDELLGKAVAARGFAKGSFYARQHLMASYDLALHGPKAQDPLALWAQMEGATPLGHVQGTLFPAGFAHIAGGYAAGYYGYLWSEVLAMDLRTAFKADKLSPEVGKRYRDIVLSNGGQRPADQLVNEFLGRPSNAKAFFDNLGVK